MKKLFILLCLSCSFLSLSQTPERVPIRPSIAECNTFYVPYNPSEKIKFDAGVGFKLTNDHSIADFSQEVDRLIAERGEDVFYKGRFYITGIDMGKARLTKEQYLKVFEDKGLSTQKVDLRVLTFPKAKIKDLSIESARALLNKTRYWFPSLSKDYEAPFFKEEVIETLLATSIIEIGSISFIMSHYQGMDAYAVLASHTALLLTYDIYKKFITNWVLRANTTKVGGLIKQLSLSLPFVISYNVMGNLTKIVDFIELNGMEMTTQLFLSQELPTFLSSQMVTLIAQTLFYRTVMSDWLGAWWLNKSGDTRMIAKSAQEKLKIPILMINAYVFAMAASPGTAVLFNIGSWGEVNMGHLGLGIMATAGLIMSKAFPKALDPLINGQIWLTEKVKAIKSYFKKPKSL